MDELIVRFEGENSDIIWKSPFTYIAYNTIIQVPFSHEVIFAKDGIILDRLEGGRHVLNEKDVKWFARGRDERMECEIFYVNKSLNMQILWGTASPIDMFDSMLKMPVSVGAHGEFEVRVKDSKRFIMQVVGSRTRAVNAQMLNDFFRGKMMLSIKTSLAKAMVQNRISYYEISSNLKELSASIKNELADMFESYGVSLESFVIYNVKIPEDVKNALADAYLQEKKKEIAGTSTKEQLEREFELNRLAITSGAGNNAAAKRADALYCAECGERLNLRAKFCCVCGAAQNYIVCTECNLLINSPSKHCCHCGKKV